MIPEKVHKSYYKMMFKQEDNIEISILAGESKVIKKQCFPKLNLNLLTNVETQGL